ncbi:hypothetical protein ACQQ2N_03230 [Dokdonella sp. MW10]|uniref:hypothetical protein n=1 Tax=Dokdonella sp. MW10 TaxID=2992926 RepID=UPI003F7E3458
MFRITPDQHFATQRRIEPSGFPRHCPELVLDGFAIVLDERIEISADVPRLHLRKNGVRLFPSCLGPQVLLGEKLTKILDTSGKERLQLRGTLHGTFVEGQAPGLPPQQKRAEHQDHQGHDEN